MVHISLINSNNMKKYKFLSSDFLIMLETELFW